MSKISEQKSLEAYPILFSERNGYDNAFKDRRESYIKGYEQAMQDFVEKACEWLKHAEGYIVTSEGGDSSMDCTFIEDFKNHMQDE